MKTESGRVTRRSAVKDVGLAAAALVGVSSGVASATTAPRRSGRADAAEQIHKLVRQTTFVDTHEHLFDEQLRLDGPTPGYLKWFDCDDWTFVISHYAKSDLISAGMPRTNVNAFFSSKTDPVLKWDLVEPYWPAIRNTGYGQAVEVSMRKLYGVERLSRQTVPRVQAGYRKWVAPGFYRKILHDMAGIESCQVNYLANPFLESKQPAFLMQDLSILGMHVGPEIKTFAPPTGINVKDLADWHAVIDWWFEKYARYAVAVKSQAAYDRSLDYEDVPAEKAAPLFKKKVSGGTLTPGEKKCVEDHLFWYAVRKATDANLPVKIHTGYLAGENRMSLERVHQHACSASELCRKAPDTRFVFMHICYPYYSGLIATAKQYSNAYLDMCWAWILNPAASVTFLKEFLMTVPANKIFTFGGDYYVVEAVLGHATMARNGITRALTDLVTEGWLTPDAAMELVEPLMRGNARGVFALEEKTRLASRR